MREKEIFGAKQPDGRGIQYIYKDMDRLENSARVAENIMDEDAEIDFTSEAYQEMIARSLMQMGDIGRVRCL